MRPGFVLRVLNRFQSVAGFDRAIALASSALTALVPLAIVAGAVLPQIGGKEAAQRIIDRYDLTGGGAEAISDVLAPASGTTTDLSIIGVFFLLVAVLSFARAVQRLIEQTWELTPLSVRNTLNGLLWIAGLAGYAFLTGLAHEVSGPTRLDIAASLIAAPLSAIFLIWSGWVLSAKRIDWRDLIPFGVLGAVLLALYSMGAAVYVPHLFSSLASRYGVIGAVFATISTLFCVMIVIVASSAAGREIYDELGRIDRGERPPDDEVRREWDTLIAAASSRWSTVRHQVKRGEKGGTPRDGGAE
jgi:membrane protein